MKTIRLSPAQEAALEKLGDEWKVVGEIGGCPLVEHEGGKLSRIDGLGKRSKATLRARREVDSKRLNLLHPRETHGQSHE